MTWNKSGIEGVGGVGLTDGAAASEPSDEELVGRAREGDQGAFSELVKRYQDRIVSAVAQRVSDREHALDLAQEVFVKAYRALPRFEARSSFYTWIYRIAINTSLSYRRKRRRAGSMLSLDRLGAGQDGDMHGLVPAPGQSPVRVVEERERAELVRRAIAELDDDFNEVVVLRDLQGLSYDAIADILQCPVGSVKSRLHRARKKLAELLREVL